VVLAIHRDIERGCSHDTIQRWRECILASSVEMRVVPAISIWWEYVIVQEYQDAARAAMLLTTPRRVLIAEATRMQMLESNSDEVAAEYARQVPLALERLGGQRSPGTQELYARLHLRVSRDHEINLQATLHQGHDAQICRVGPVQVRAIETLGLLRPGVYLNVSVNSMQLLLQQELSEQQSNMATCTNKTPTRHHCVLTDYWTLPSD
jgi:hypothetical protein